MKYNIKIILSFGFVLNLQRKYLSIRKITLSFNKHLFFRRFDLELIIFYNTFYNIN